MTEKPTYEKLGQKDKLFSVPWRIYLKICIVGLIIISMFVYGFYKCHRMGRIYTPLIDAAIEIKLQAALAHLWLDEIISDDRQDYINKVWEHHDKAECYAKAMSEGGETPDRILMPIEDAEISGKLKSIRGKLKEFREVAKKRMGTKGTSGIGTDINRRYDHIFWSFLKEADEVETNFQQIMAKDFSRYMHTQIILIFITILLFLVSGIFFWHFDSQRVKNIILLNNANSALQKSEKNFAITFNSIGDAVISTDTEGNILQMNPVAEKLTGWNFSEARGCHLRAVFNIVNEETRQRVESPVKKVLHKGVAVKITNHTILIAKNGTEYSVEDSCAPIRDGYGTITGVVLVFRDVSEKRREAKKLRESEEKLIRSKKMESLGLLVSGVAHDLNNILSGIVGYPELMLTDLPEDSQLREPILAMQESGHRAVAVVQDLLTLARGVAITKKTLKLNDIVRDYLNSPEFEKLKQFHPLVTINSNLGNDLFNVSGSYIHIRKALMNLVSNAAETIEGRGNTTISTMNRYIDSPLRGYNDVNIGEYVVLAVSDDGPGIASDDLERIFEPFYTKKVLGRSGTGLGLTVVWNVLHDHNGYINVISSKNGTTFELFYPITREEISVKDSSISIEDFKGSGEVILIVDDVASQRKLHSQMLNKLGYKTKTVSSGEEAVEYLKEHSIDLILLDMIMPPGINGRETFEKIIEIHPYQKTILISGFVERDEIKAAQKKGAGQYIKKPVTLKKLGRAVKKELGLQRGKPVKK